MEMFQLKKDKFVNWYFSDKDTQSSFGNNAIWELQTFGMFCVTVDELFTHCGYIPQWLCEGQSPDEGEDLDPQQVILIN